MAKQPSPFVTEEQYLAIDRASPDKREYWHSQMWSMPGGTFDHNKIAMRIGQLLLNSMPDTYSVLSSDMRIHISETGLYTYADVSVVRNPPQFKGEAQDILTNPVAVVEVLSPSTRDYDLGGKQVHYTSIRSLEAYITVEQDQPLVTVCYLGKMTHSFGLNNIISFRNMPAILPVNEIYAGKFR